MKRVFFFSYSKSKEACKTSSDVPFLKFIYLFFGPVLNREAHSNNRTSALALCDERALDSTCFLKYAVSLPEPLLSVPYLLH